MRATSSVLWALLVLLLFSMAEMRRAGRGKGLKGARHGLARDRYGTSHSSSYCVLPWPLHMDCNDKRIQSMFVSNPQYLSWTTTAGLEAVGAMADRAQPGLWPRTAQSLCNPGTSFWTARSEVWSPSLAPTGGPRSPNTFFWPATGYGSYATEPSPGSRASTVWTCSRTRSPWWRKGPSRACGASRRCSCSTTSWARWVRRPWSPCPTCGTCVSITTPGTVSAHWKASYRPCRSPATVT